MKKIKILILSLVAVAFFSCEPTYVKEYNWAYPVAGDWTVNVYVDGVLAFGPYEIKTYNSSFGKDSIWIDDYQHLWPMKFKAFVDMNAKTFKTDSVRNAFSSKKARVVVANGKIVNNDSIYFEARFEDDTDAANKPLPWGTTYQIAGHRLTSYEEYMQQ